MTVRKGLSTLIDIDPNFSNQAIENAVNGLKQGWVIKSVVMGRRTPVAARWFVAP